MIQENISSISALAVPVQNPTLSKAVKLKFSLLRLAQKQTDKDLRKHLNRLATLTRQRFEGFSDKEVRRMLLEHFCDYSDGETAQSLTVYDLKDLTKLQRIRIVPVLEMMVRSGDILETDKIPDFFQYGDHGERSFRLNLDKPMSRTSTP